MAETKPVVVETPEQEIQRLRAENEALRARQAAGVGRLTVKASTKGAVSVYGLGRWPVTLYREQWERLLTPEQAKAILGFIVANDKTLARKQPAA